MRLRVFAGLIAVLGAACATAPEWRRAPHDRPFQAAPAPKPHRMPEPTRASEWWTVISYAGAGPISRGVNPGYWVERLLDPPAALDVNAFGQVLDSTWFTNRLALDPRLSPARIARGPNRAAGPADGPLLVLGGKAEGATPGLLVQDTRGARYLVKFDPPAFPELASGAEIIATKVLWAAGYHVPENYVVRFELSRLALSPDATTSGRYGATIPLTEQMVRDLVALVNPYPDGTIRALFSRIIDGEPLGPFSYRGTRPDDPNDTVPHERRRSLRGLRLFSAWLNNVDTRDANSLDVFVPAEDAPQLGFVKHYLLDFGDALGSAGTSPKYPGEGYEGLLDWPLVMQSLGTLGLRYRYWLPIRRAPHRAVGIFEAQVFEPERWRPHLPNPAFDSAGTLDDYWAASIIARFDVEDLVAIVRAAEYSDRAAEAWVLRVLLQRQYRILEWVFSKVLPLDALRILDGYRVHLEDLAVRAALLEPGQVGYRYRLVWHRPEGPVEVITGENFLPQADLQPAIASLDPEALAASPFFTLEWSRPLPTPDLPPVKVHLRHLPEGLLAVGVEREAR